MLDPSIGRWFGEDPIDFGAGDANLYRDRGNNPTNATDPSGLWAWRVSSEGAVQGVAEPNDTLASLAKMGYDNAKLMALAGQLKVQLDGKLPDGMVVDLSSFFPEPVRAVLSRQQALNMAVLGPILRTQPSLKSVPLQGTLGKAGFDLMRELRGNGEGEVTQVPPGSTMFGLGTCYGFVGLFHGRQPPDGILPQDYSLAPLKGEKVAGSRSQPEKPTITRSAFGVPQNDGKPKQISFAVEHPTGGLMQFFTGGREKTDRPNYGAIALFYRDEVVCHAAIVLGRSNAGEVFVIQKMNNAQPYTVSKITHPAFGGFKPIEFYQ